MDSGVLLFWSGAAAFLLFQSFLSVDTENSSFSLFLEERFLASGQWPREVFLLSFNFRTIYIDLELKEIIFCITTVSIGPLLEMRKTFDIVTPDFLSFSIFCPFTLSR